MSCRGKYLHIATLMRKYTRGLSTPSRPDLLVPAAETVLTDGRTDVKKKVRFLEKVVLVRTGPNRTAISVFWTFCSVFSDAVRTALSQKNIFEEKRPLHVCVIWVNLPLSPELRNLTCVSAIECWVQNPKQARSKPWYQIYKRKQIVWESLLLYLRAAKAKMAPIIMSCKLAMWHIYLISTISAVPPWVNITNMQKKQYLVLKKYFRKNKCRVFFYLI